jgi:hypothetical protein
MAWITIPNVFRGKGGQRVPVSQIDDDFQYLADKLNGFNPTGAPAGPGGIYGVRNLVGGNDVGFPATRYGFSADAWLLRSPTDGSFIVRTATGVLTNDITVPGPTPNGTDQPNPFPSPSWVHLYGIWSPSSGILASLSSVNPPPTGPSLPAGFTMWGYAAAIRRNASGNLRSILARGSMMVEHAAVQVVTGASPAMNAETAVDVSTAIPPNALTYLCNTGTAFFNGSTSGTNFQMRVISGQNMSPLRGTVFGGSGAPITAQFIMPNLNQNYFYSWFVDIPNAPTFVTDQWVTAYNIPNGGE